MSNPILIEVTRGALVESAHRGAIAVVDAAGKTRAAIGDVGRRVFPRSAVKALQALPLVESGAADRYGFGTPNWRSPVPPTTASRAMWRPPRRCSPGQGGAKPISNAARRFPRSHGAAEALLLAGIAPGQLHNNCSGKHAGFICLACHRGLDPEGLRSARPPGPA